MEAIVRKVSLAGSDATEARRLAELSPAQRMDILAELLARGASFYQTDETTKGYPRVYRIVALGES